MIFFCILCIIFFSMLFFPIAIAMMSAHYEVNPILIKQSNTKDPRYFANSFKKIFDKAWETYDKTGILHMSHDEKVIEGDKTELLPFEVCTFILYFEKKNFISFNKSVFEKEIYIKGNAQIGNENTLRAILCGGKLTIKDGTKIIRWADSQGMLTVYDDCDLGISTSSGTELFIGENCSFKRLYAPVIMIGKKKHDFHEGITSCISEKFDPIIFSNIMRDIEYVDGEITNEEGILKSTIITRHDMTVLGKLQVQGHISCHKDVKIDNDAVIHGNIFAEGSIFIGMNVRVLGVLFSQENIYVEDGAVIGQLGKIKSVVARKDIVFGNNCRVHGYIGTEAKGSICPRGM